MQTASGTYAALEEMWVMTRPEDGAPETVPSARILIAGIGNIFFGDDAFGAEAARVLSHQHLPGGVSVVDFGIRSYDLAYALSEGHEAVILLDATRAAAGREQYTCSSWTRSNWRRSPPRARMLIRWTRCESFKWRVRSVARSRDFTWSGVSPDGWEPSKVRWV